MVRSEYSRQEMSDILDMIRLRWVMQEGKESFEGSTFGFPVVEKEKTGWTQEFKAELDKIARKDIHI